MASRPWLRPGATDRYTVNGRHLGYVEPIPQPLFGIGLGWFARDPFGEFVRNDNGSARVFQQPADAEAALREAARQRDEVRRECNRNVLRDTLRP